ncbi:MAG: SLC13 family permease [bacterium]|nr:SLC13 family permease [bacterium]
MDLDSVLLFAIIAFAMAAFVREWLPLDVVALTSLGLLLLFGLVSPKEAIGGFSNEAVITVMMMFILSDGLLRSGLIGKLAHRLADMSGATHWKGSITLMLVAGVLSAFINNVAALTIFMPVSIHLAKHYRISPSKLLLPLSYATIFGGACTLVGTSSNLLVSSLAADYGFEPFEMFEFLGLGGILFAVGMLYNFTVPMRYLPSRSILSSLTRKYQISSYLTELKIAESSKLVGRTVVEERVHEHFRLNVLEVIRGKQKIATDIRNTRLQAGDMLIVRGTVEDILSFKERSGLLLLVDLKLRDSDIADDQNILAEIQLSPTSELGGLTLKKINFRNRYGCFVLALNRTGEVIREKIASIPLKPWDTLLVFGPRPRIEALHSIHDFIPLQELELRLHLPRKWWIGAAIVPVVMILAATGVMSILKASILGVVAMLVTRRLTIQQAYQAVNWTVIFLVAAILPMGTAMNNTGLAQWLGGGVAELGSRFGLTAVVALLFLVTSVLSEIMSNNSTAVLMIPIAVNTAAGMGLDVKPLLMAVTIAAATSFLTPMGYKTNTVVYGPGGYRFMDYIRAGFPLKVIFWILATILIPLFWPI